MNNCAGTDPELQTAGADPGRQYVNYSPIKKGNDSLAIKFI